MLEPLSYAIENLQRGATFANLSAGARADAQSNLADFYLPGDDWRAVRRLGFSFSLIGPGIERLEPLVTQFYPSHQETIWGTEGLILTQRIFVPYETSYERAVCWLIEVQAEGPRVLQVDIEVDMGRGELRLQDGLLVANDGDVPRRVCVFGSSGPPTAVDVSRPGVARLTYHILIEGEVEQPFILTASEAGESLAWNGFLMVSDVEQTFRQTTRALTRRLAQARVYTPDAGVNRALVWAAVNALRGQQRYRAGHAVPTCLGSALVGVEAAAVYALAANWLSPDFVGRLLHGLAGQELADTMSATFNAHSGAAEGPPAPTARALLDLALARHRAAGVAPPAHVEEALGLPPPPAGLSPLAAHVWQVYRERHAAPDAVYDTLQLAHTLVEDPHPAGLGRVPGQYPQRLENVSPGETLDPVVGALLLALPLEGLLGLAPGPDALRVAPRLPAEWNWLAAANVPYRGDSLTLAYHNGVLHSTLKLTSTSPVETYARAALIPGDVFAVLFERPDARRLFAASDAATATFIRLDGRTVSVQLAAGEATLVDV